MIKHLFKLMWNRKRKNFLMMLEIFISFIVLFVALSILIFNIKNYSKPLGFSHKNVWLITMEWKDMEREEIAETLKQMKFVMEGYPEIEGNSLSRCYLFMPYTTSNGDFNYEGKETTIDYLMGEDEFPNVMDVKILDGRWFNDSDNAFNKIPVIINRNTEKNLFQGESALGKIFADNYDDSKKEFEVIGIIDDFRNTGQFSTSKNVMFQRINLNDDIDNIKYIRDSMLNRMLLKVKPGTGADFEEILMKQLNLVAKGFDLKIQTAEDARKFSNKSMIILPLILLIISGFLVINVALGLFGIIWYNINQRKSEIGLRRALGAPVRNIFIQILGESIVLSTFSIILGLAVAIQFPLLNFIGFINVEIYYFSITATVISIYLVSLICALYPSKLASDIQPAIALHYE